MFPSLDTVVGVLARVEDEEEEDRKLDGDDILMVR